MPREHGADGTYVETTPRERVFEVFDAVEGPVILSADVADTLGCSRETARRKLAELYDRGELDRRKVSRRMVYWKPGETRDTAARAGAGDTPGDAPGEPSTDTRTDTRAESDTLEDRARARIEEVDLAGSGADYEHRRDAVLKMYEHLRDHPGERMRKSDFRDLLDGDNVGYGSGFESLWSNWVKGSSDRPNLLDEFPGVELRGDDYVYEVIE